MGLASWRRRHEACHSKRVSPGKGIRRLFPLFRECLVALQFSTYNLEWLFDHCRDWGVSADLFSSL